MEISHASSFQSVPWCVAVLTDREWTVSAGFNRAPKPSGEDSFIAETLATGRTVPEWVTLVRQPSANSESKFAEARLMVNLGPGVNGWPNVLHGGLVSTLLDEATGTAVAVNAHLREEKMGRKSGPCYTANLNVTFIKPVPTPGPLLCQARLTKFEGRKSWSEATLEDGKGVVYAKAEALYVELLPSKS